MPLGEQKEIVLRIKRLAETCGFDAFGVTAFGGSGEEEARLDLWIREGRHGTMKYLEDYRARQERLIAEIPDAKSVLVLGVNYYQQESVSASNPAVERVRGRVARYAWGEDYHAAIRRRHDRFLREMESVMTAPFRAVSCIDTKPFLEREAAVRSGLGFAGKNTMLLSKTFGPWLFLSEIITNLDLPESIPSEGSCGTCVRCQDICPTGALDQDYRMDARKCIAYLTIEHKGVIDRELRPQIKDWVFGCDECLTVCPFTSHQKETAWPELKANSERAPWLDLEVLFDLRSNKDYEERFRNSALLRAGRKQMLRNACIVLGNTRSANALGLLEKGLQDTSALVRLHAAWAIGQIQDKRSLELLEARLGREEDESVKAEIQAAICSITSLFL